MPTFDTTLGGSATTSYVTLAEFRTYLDELIFIPNFPKDDALTQRILNASTKILDREDYWGNTVDDVQALVFPRTGVYDVRDFSVDNIIPVALKEATYELALFLFQEKTNHNLSDLFNEANSVSISGDVNMTFSRNIYKVKIPHIVKVLLRSLRIETRPRVMR